MCFIYLPAKSWNYNWPLLLALFLQKETDTTGRHTRACSWTLPPPLRCQSSSTPLWLNTHSYRNTAALSAQPARPGWGCTAAQKAHFNNSDSDFPLLSLRKGDDFVSRLFLWHWISAWNSAALGVLNKNLTAELISHDKCSIYIYISLHTLKWTVKHST